MAILLEPWLENTLILAPFIYAIGFFIVEDSVTYGLAGALSSLFALFFGYYILDLPAFAVFFVYTIILSLTGAGAGQLKRLRARKQLEKTGIEPTSVEPHAGRHHAAQITGTVHDAGDPDAPIPNATVSIFGSGVQSRTDEQGMYTLEMLDTAFIFKKQVIIIADHGGYYTQHSKPVLIKGGTTTTLDLPMQHLISPAGALGNIRISITDDHGKPVPPEMKPGDRFGCRITADAPLRFDCASRTHATPEQPDTIEFVNQETGQTLLILTEDILPTQGTMRYTDPRTLFITSTVPGHYLDGPGNTPKTPISSIRDLKVKIIAHLNVT